MTVSSQTNNATFVGNGITTAFPLPFRFFDNGDVYAYFIDSATGASTPMLLGTDYTLAGEGEPEVDGNPVSVLTTSVPLASMRGLYVERVMPQVQETDIVNQDRFFASTHEDVFDRLTMLIQQSNSNSQGAIRVAIGDPDPNRLPPVAQRALLIMGFDSFGNPIAIAPGSGSSEELALLLASSLGTNYIGRGAGTLENALDTLDLAAINRVVRLSTAAAAASSSISGSAVIEGYTTAGDGAANLVVLDADDSTSPNDGVRAIESAGGTLRSVLHMQGAEIPLPAGFGYTPLVKIIKTAKGYAADKDARSLMPAITGVTYYVDYITGNDANAGTAVAPLKGIKAALAKVDVGRVKVAPAFYPHNYNWASTFPAGRNFSVERWEGIRPGPVINSTADDALTWTVNGTYSNVWQATRSIVAKVRDYSRRAADGRYFEYRSVASLLLCSQTSGTYYYDGSIVYVNTLENAKPHSQVKVFLETAAAYFNTTFAVLIDGIEFHGGREAFYPTNTGASGGLLIANDCKFMYAQNATVGNGVRLEGIEDSYFQNCEASYNNRDGFNYHVATTVIPKVTEINCRGFYNGQDGAGVNNGSTMHDAGRIVRIGGEFAYSEGPQVVDVGNSKSFNAGVHAYASRLGLDTIANANFYLSGGEMWLLDCDAEYSLYDAAITSGGAVYTCRTPIRTSNIAPSYYIQKVGDIKI